MIFETPEEIIELIKQNQGVSHRIAKAREMAKELRALIKGVDFDKELIHRIEKLENMDKAVARNWHTE